MRNYFVGIVLTQLCLLSCAYSETYLSPDPLALDSNKLFIGQTTAQRVDVIDVLNTNSYESILLDSNPSGLTLSADRETLYITSGVSSGIVQVVDVETLNITSTIAVGHSPCSPTLCGTDKLYVCNQFKNDISVVDLNTGSEVRRIDVLREPYASAITPDESMLVVANLIPHMASTNKSVTSAVSLIDTATDLVSTNILLPRGAHSLRDVEVSPDGNYAWITHVISKYKIPTTQLQRGWINTAALTIIDLSSQTHLNTILLDDLDLGAANPWGIACSEDGEKLIITHAGTHEVSVIDWSALLLKIQGTSEDLSTDLVFLAGLRRRISLEGKGPRSVVLSGNTAYVSQYFSEKIAVVDIAEGNEFNTYELQTSTPEDLNDVRRGELAFYDGTLSEQHWHSCSSCHPDTRSDGMNWDILNDGFGNAKNSKSLLYSHATPPTTITGVRGSASISVMAGLEHIHFVNESMDGTNFDIEAYLASLEAIPSPWLENGQLSESALRGKPLYNQYCLSCHSGEYYTDLQLYNVGTGTGPEEGVEFDTPTLRECWRTAPYFYNGKAETMGEVIDHFVPGLSESDRNDLVNYVNSI